MRKKSILGVLAILAMIGIASGALLNVYVSVTGEATADQAVTFDDGNTHKTFSFDGNNVVGETVIDSYTLENNANKVAPVTFESTQNHLGTGHVEDDVVGITTNYVEYFDEAGADIPAYDAPANCNVTVNSGDSIQTAINNADAGDTICVKPGTYDESITIDESLTLVSTTEYGAIIDGEGVTLSSPSTPGWNSLVAITADDVTFKGFKVTNSADRGISAYGSSNNVLKDIVVKHNTVTDNDAGGIQAEYSQVIVSDNKAKDNAYDGFVSYHLGDGSTIENNILSLNGPSGIHGDVWHDSGIEVGLVDSATVAILGNTIEDNAGSSSSAQGASVGAGIYLRDSIDSSNTVTIKSNVITGNSDYGIASKVADASGISINNNNIVDNNLGVQHNDNGMLDANNNWWGTDGINVTDNVNATWMDKDAQFTLQPGQTDTFGIINDFNIALQPGTYDVTTEVVPQ